VIQLSKELREEVQRFRKYLEHIAPGHPALKVVFGSKEEEIEALREAIQEMNNEA